MPEHTDERRTHPRVSRVVEIEGLLDGDSARLVGTNLSLGGVYCTSARDFPEMTRLSVRLLLRARSEEATAEPLDVDAVVVRRQAVSAQPHVVELALLFPTLNAYQRDRIARFLA